MAEKQETETEFVDVESIVQHEAFQVRERLDERTVARYGNVLKNGNDMPPITLARVDGVLFCVDGFHRLAAMKAVANRESVEAKIVDATRREAHLLALTANLANGLPLKNAEVRNAFGNYVKAGWHRDELKRLKSYRKIAQELGGLKPHTTIRAWMTADFPKIAEQYSGETAQGAGGHRPMNGDSVAVMVRQDLNNVRAAFPAIASAEDRGSVIRLTAEVLRALEEMAGQREPDF